MRDVYLWLMLGFPAVAMANAWWFGRELKLFVDATPVISSTVDIERMKAVVARQMRAALVQIVLLAAGPMVFVVGLVRGVLQPTDALCVIVPAASVIVLSLGSRATEARARSLDAADEGLARQRDAIVETWLKKPLPDW